MENNLVAEFIGLFSSVPLLLQYEYGVLTVAWLAGWLVSLLAGWLAGCAAFVIPPTKNVTTREVQSLKYLVHLDGVSSEPLWSLFGVFLEYLLSLF